jgi:hypothetical protein
MIFYSNGGWESDGMKRVAGCDGVNSILRFRLEKRGDGTKYCRKMSRGETTG